MIIGSQRPLAPSQVPCVDRRQSAVVGVGGVLDDVRTAAHIFWLCEIVPGPTLGVSLIDKLLLGGEMGLGGGAIGSLLRLEIEADALRLVR